MSGLYIPLTTDGVIYSFQLDGNVPNGKVVMAQAVGHRPLTAKEYVQASFCILMKWKNISLFGNDTGIVQQNLQKSSKNEGNFAFPIN